MSDVILKVKWQWTDKQRQALNEECRYLLWGGSKGAGKTVMLCRWAALEALNHPGNRGFLGRQRSVDFTNTTLETFMKFVDNRLYTVNQQSKRIVFKNGSVIFYGGMDDQKTIAKFNSAEFGFIGIDQAEEISADAFGLLCGTLRFILPDGTRPKYMIRMTANPAQCWLVNRFIQHPDHEHKFIPALPADNPFLPPEYIPNLEKAFKHRPELVAAYVHGSWDVVAGADLIIKPSWVRGAVNLKLHNPSKKRIVACDPARMGDDETVIYVMEGPRKIFQEIYGQKDTMYTAGRLAILQREYQAEMVVIDKGTFGAAIYDRLCEMAVPCMGIDFGGKASTPEKEAQFRNRRTEMYWDAGAMFADGAVTIDEGDELLINQLSDIKYKPSEGKILAEPKDAIKQRNSNQSPDRADTFVMGLHALQFVPEAQGDFNRIIVEQPIIDSYGWEQRESMYV